MLVGLCYGLEVDKQNLLRHHLTAVWGASAEPAGAHDPACRPRFRCAPACGRPPACTTARLPTSFCSMVAVSHGYAWECQTQEGGWGLHAVFQEHAWKLRGGWGLLISVGCR